MSFREDGTKTAPTLTLEIESVLDVFIRTAHFEKSAHPTLRSD